MVEVRKTEKFTKWFNRLKDVTISNRINYRLRQIELKNHFGDFKYLEAGVYELRFFFGNAIRIYYTKQGDDIVLLLVGGDKSTQSSDIEQAKKMVQEL